MIHSSTLGYSPFPPVSVYGTGRHTLHAPQIFSQACLPALSAWPKPRGTVGFQFPYALQPSIPSDGGSVTPRSLLCLHGGCRNLDRLSIACASRLPLRSRLTLIRLTLFRKPWVFGVGISIPIVVTYAYIFFSVRSNGPRGSVFDAGRNAPLPRALRRVLGFGDSFYARSSSTHHRSTSELLRTL